ncbi:hypothetical protein FQR65_LT20249 [Abscondita terminalis]|nr:hypothetical protein FQR65_LT20249 [Abscondita terminalis]
MHRYATQPRTEDSANLMAKRGKAKHVASRGAGKEIKAVSDFGRQQEEGDHHRARAVVPPECTYPICCLPRKPSHDAADKLAADHQRQADGGHVASWPHRAASVGRQQVAGIAKGEGDLLAFNPASAAMDGGRWPPDAFVGRGHHSHGRKMVASAGHCKRTSRSHPTQANNQLLPSGRKKINWPTGAAGVNSARGRLPPAVAGKGRVQALASSSSPSISSAFCRGHTLVDFWAKGVAYRFRGNSCPVPPLKITHRFCGGNAGNIGDIIFAGIPGAVI